MRTLLILQAQGNGRQRIFRQDEERAHFLLLLERMTALHQMRLHVLALERNAESVVSITGFNWIVSISMNAT